MKNTKNTFGAYKFSDWIPEHTREIIRDFWGQMGRTHRNWLENVKFDQRDFCYHGPNPDGFGNPPNGAKAIYFTNHGGVYEKIEGRYLHRWNNMGSLIDENGKDRTVSSCDRWVRVFRNEKEKELLISTP